MLLLRNPTTLSRSGAGEGNRTLVLSLEGFSSTIELHPLNPNPPLNRNLIGAWNCWWREKDSNLRRQSRQIYSLIPLTAWVSLQLGTENFDTTAKRCQSVISELGETIPEPRRFYTILFHLFFSAHPEFPQPPPSTHRQPAPAASQLTPERHRTRTNTRSPSSLSSSTISTQPPCFCTPDKSPFRRQPSWFIWHWPGRILVFGAKNYPGQLAHMLWAPSPWRWPASPANRGGGA